MFSDVKSTHWLCFGSVTGDPAVRCALQVRRGGGVGGAPLVVTLKDCAGVRKLHSRERELEQFRFTGTVSLQYKKNF